MVITKRLFKQCMHKQHRYMSSKEKETPAEYCLNLVKNNDYENFLCTLLLPQNLKSTAFAIRAFNVEVALVEDRIKDKQIGLMRMKFWDKVVENVYNNKPSKTPVALELHRVLQKHNLNKEHLKKLVDARDYKLTATKFLNLESVEKYAESTVSPIYYLLLEANKVEDQQVLQFASHVGKAQGIVTLIRSINHNARTETLVLPEDLMAKHNLTPRMVFKGETSDELRKTVSEIADKAKEHLEKASSLKHHVKGNTKLIFLPASITTKYLKNLSKQNYDIHHESLVKRNNFLAWQLLARKMIKKPF